MANWQYLIAFIFARIFADAKSANGKQIYKLATCAWAWLMILYDWFELIILFKRYLINLVLIMLSLRVGDIRRCHSNRATSWLWVGLKWRTAQEIMLLWMHATMFSSITSPSIPLTTPLTPMASTSATLMVSLSVIHQYHAVLINHDIHIYAWSSTCTCRWIDVHEFHHLINIIYYIYR